MPSLSVRLYASASLAIVLAALTAVPASAQYRPRQIDNPAMGENYYIEGGIDWWSPTADMTVTSSGTGALSSIVGSAINAQQDLGFVDQTMPAFHLTLRPAPRHKIRFQYIPMDYVATTTLQRTLVFNGQSYQVGLPVNSELNWKAFRFGYEYDFVRRNEGFAGIIAEAKYTDVNISLQSPVASEFVQARAPIPAIGGIGRYYIIPRVSITGEVTLFKLPTIADKYAGHYVDVDIYGTANITKNVGVQGGFRSLDLGYLVKQDTGSFTLKGLYFGFVARY